MKLHNAAHAQKNIDNKSVLIKRILLIVASVVFIYLLATLPIIKNAFADFDNNENAATVTSEEKQDLNEKTLNYKSTKGAAPLVKNSKSSNEEAMESKYDFSGQMPELKDQSPFGVCWTFAPMAAMEANLIIKGMADNSIDLAERQLGYFFYYKNKIADPLNLITNSYTSYIPKVDESQEAYPSYLDAGNNSCYSMWTLASWCGPVLEEQAPYNEIADYSSKENLTPGYIAYIMSIKDEDRRKEKWEEIGCHNWTEINARYHEALNNTKLDDDLCFNSDAYHVTDITQVPLNYQENGNSIKKQIKEKGAVAAAYYEDGKNEGGDYDKATNTYYDGQQSISNHAITLVGWDDNKQVTNCDKPGAWKVRNSWWSKGDDVESHNGYFWISYYCACFNDVSNCAYSYDVNSLDTYDKNYQYDGTASYSSVLKLPTNYSFSNVYTAQEDEEIKGVSLGVCSTDSKLDLKIYTGDGSSPVLSNLPYEDNDVSIDNAGCRFVSLKEPVKVSSGQKFSVVFTNNSEKEIELCVDDEYNNENDPVSFHPSLEEGRSFYGGGSNWYDVCQWNKCYLRIKAYTKKSAEPQKDISKATVSEIDSSVYSASEITPEPEITFDGQTLEKGKDYTLSYRDNFNAGKATIIITGIGNYTNTKEVQFDITPATLTATAVSESINYSDRDKWSPKVVVTGFIGKDEQTHPIDYSDPEVKGPDPSTVGPGEDYEIIIYGGSPSGNYEFDCVPGTLTINKGNLEDATVDPVQSERYDSKVHTPDVMIHYDKFIVQQADCVITYSNNVNAGEATVIITATEGGHYTGTKTATFQITPVQLTASFNSCTVDYKDYDAKNLDDEIIVEGFVYGEDPTNAAGYVKPTVGEKPEKVPGALHNLVPKNGSANNYIFTYVPGTLMINGVYMKDVTVEPIADCVYDAKNLEPNVKISYGGSDLVKGEDYSLEFSNNVHVTNQAKVTITGLGNYVGTRDALFNINKLPVNVSVTSKDIYYSEFDNYTPEFKVETFLEDNPLDYVAPTISGVPAKKDVKLGQSYTLTARGASAKDYSFNYSDGFLKINPGISLNNATIEDIPDITYGGVEQKPEPKVRLNGKELTKGVDFEFSYENNTHVNYEGYTPTVVVKGIGDYIDSVSKTFNITKRDATVKFKDSYVDYVDYPSFKPEFEIDFVGQDKTSTPLKYVAPQADLPSTVVRGEEYTITCSGGSANDYNFTEYKFGKLTINPATDISGATVELPESVTYSGDEQTPDVTVALKSKTLTKDIDYSVTYTNNIDAGTANVIISGKDAYRGTITRTFTIEKAKLKAIYDSAEMKFSEFDAYTPTVTVKGFVGRDIGGTPRGYTKPTVTKPSSVKAGDSISLIPSGGVASDYTFEYAAGTLSINEAINIDLASASKIDDVLYTGSAHTPSFELTYDDNKLELNKDYTVEYKDNIHATDRAKIFVSGMGDFGGEKIIEFKIKKALLTATMDDAAINYSQFATWTPNVTVTGFVDSEHQEYIAPHVVKPASVELGKEYELKPEGGQAHDYYFEYIKGKLTINPGVDISNATFGTIKEDLTYSATEKYPSPDVVVNGKLLTKDKDYELTYSDNIHVAYEEHTPTIHVKGIGDYIGTTTKEFEIEPAPLTAKFNDIYVSYEDYDSYTPEIEVSGFKGGEDPSSAQGYVAPTIVKPSPIERGQKFTLTPEGGSANDYVFTTHTSGVLTINEATSISTAKVEVVSSVDYNGKAQTPDVAVSLNDKTLVKDTDYSLTFENNIYAGKAKVIITGINAYKDSKTVTFDITKAKLTATYAGATISFNDFKNYIPVVNVEGFVDTDPRGYVAPTVAKPESVVPGTTYELTPAGGQALDYEFEYTGGFLNINPAIDIVNAVAAPISGVEYNGAQQKPEPSLTYDNNVLKPNIDYTLSYSNNIHVTDEALITITGIGNYTGTKDIKFSIKKAKLTATMENATINYSQFETWTPTVSVTGFVDKDHLGYVEPIVVKPKPQEIKHGVSYDLIPSGGVALDYYFNYEPGSLTINAAIDISGATFGEITDDLTYSASAKTPTPDITVNNKVLTKDVDYTLSYKDNIHVKHEGYTPTILVTGIGDYKGTASKEFKIVQAPLKAEFIDASVAFEEYESYTPKATVIGFKGDDTAASALDYVAPTIEKPGSVIRGQKYKLTPIDGSANDYVFTEHTSGWLTINEATSIKDASVGPIEPVIYAGKDQTPEPVVKLNDKTLVKDTDYSLTYEDNYYPGTAKVIITGINAYKDSVEAKFEIKKAKLTATYIGATISYNEFKDYDPQINVEGFVDDPREYVEPTVTKPTSIELGKSYDLTPANGEAKDYEFVYVGAKLTIREGIDISKATVSAIEEKAYTGKEQKPTPDVSYDGTALVNGQDYKLSYLNNINAGTAKLVIDGLGNYSGQKIVEFSIAKAPLTAEYKGSEIHYLDFDSYEFIKDTEITGFVNSETKETAAGYKDPTFDKPYDQDPGKTKEYTPEGGSAANYEFETYVPGDLTIQVLEKEDTDISKEDIFIIKFEDESNNLLKASNKAYPYQGKEIKPQVQVIMKDLDTGVERPMKEGKHFNVNYDDNINVGTATTLVSGINQFSGSRENEFEITKAKLTVSVEDAIVSIGQYADYQPKLIFSGFVGGETEETAKGFIAPTVDKPKDVEAGKTYTLRTNEDGKADNYEFAYKTGTLSVIENPVPGGDVTPGGDSSSSAATSDFNCILLLGCVIVCVLAGGVLFRVSRKRMC